MTGPKSSESEGSDLIGRVRELETTVERLSERLSALERNARSDIDPFRRSQSTTDSPLAAGAFPAQPPSTAVDTDLHQPGWLTLAGRTFLVLAGAFLLRAVTDAGQLPVAGGVWAALAYASLWVGFAHVSVGRSSLVHGLTALLVGLPLVFEAASRFSVLNARSSALALAMLAALLHAASWRRSLPWLARATSAGTIVTAFALAMALDTYPVFALLVLGVAIATLWIGDARDWAGLGWPAAAAADLMIVVVTIRGAVTPPRDTIALVLALQAALVVAYLGSIILRVLLHERPARPLDMIQTLTVLVIGIFGAVSVATTQGLGTTAIAVPCLVGAGLLYTQSFTRIARQRGTGREFYFFGMTALGLALAGVALLLPRQAATTCMALGALGATVLGWRSGHSLLALQGALAAATAALLGGLAGFTVELWLLRAETWPEMTGTLAIVWMAIAAALFVPRTAHTREPLVLGTVARTLLALAFTAGSLSLLVRALGPPVAGTPADASVLATLRTALLAASAVALADIGRRRGFQELGWMAWLALAAGAVKLFVQDLPASTPFTLFVAFAAYGAALIAVPRVARQR